MLSIDKKKQFILKHDISKGFEQRILSDNNEQRINDIFNVCVSYSRDVNDMKQHSEVESKENIIDMLDDELTDLERNQLEEYL